MILNIFIVSSILVSKFDLSMIGYRKLDLLRKVRTKLIRNGYEIDTNIRNVVSSTMIKLDSDINQNLMDTILVILSVPPILNLTLLKKNIKRFFYDIHDEYIDDEYDRVIDECTSTKVIEYLERKKLIHKREIDLNYDDIEEVYMNNIDKQIENDINNKDNIKLSELLRKYDSFELNESLSRLCMDRVISASYEDDPSFIMVKKRKLVMKKGNENGKNIN